MTSDTKREITSQEVYQQCADFLFKEAEYLDTRQFWEWLACMHEDLVYEMPVRVTRGPEARDAEFSRVGYHMKDSYKSIKMRVSRLYTEHAYAEDPPSRTQRLIANVRVPAVLGDRADVRSNFMCYRSQGDSVEYDLIVGERLDVLHNTADGWKLERRTVHLAHTTIGTANLGVFL
jgi:3-phenylpropionate/cinnamic acid dioxygenase small subunit